MSTIVEFYDTEDNLVAAVGNVGALPRAGERLNILKQTWLVLYVTWNVDYADSANPNVRANVYMEKK